MASEEAKFSVLLKEQNFEVREYEPHVVAQTRVEGEFSSAGRQAFGRLFKYISGYNEGQHKVAMTLPVAQTGAHDDHNVAEGSKIAMTSPVVQQQGGIQQKNGGWQLSFMMPAGSRIDTLPVPKDPSVSLQAVSAQKMAAVRYSGTWSERAYLEHKHALQAWLQTQGYQADGEAKWARYNPPFTLWFLRRNEVLIPIARVSK